MNKVLSIAIIVLLIISVGFGESTDEKRLQVKKGGNLDVELRYGNIEISTWNKNEILIKYDKNSYEDSEIEIKQSDNNVLIRMKEHHSYLTNLEVSVPEEFNLNLSTNGGNIKIDGSLTGNFKGRTDGGNFRVNDINGNINLRTAGGNINCGNLNGDASLVTSGGEIVAGNLSGKGEIKTAGGSISLGNIFKNTTISTAGGNITIGDVKADITLKTAGGNLKIKSILGNCEAKTAGGNITLQYAKGNIKLATAGGNIVTGMIEGILDASTAAGDIEATINPKPGSSMHIKTSAGDISVSLPENAKTEINAKLNLGGMYWDDEINPSDFIISEFKPIAFEKMEDEETIKGEVKINGGGSNIKLTCIDGGKIYIRKINK